MKEPPLCPNCIETDHIIKRCPPCDELFMQWLEGNFTFIDPEDLTGEEGLTIKPLPRKKKS